MVYAQEDESSSWSPSSTEVPEEGSTSSSDSSSSDLEGSSPEPRPPRPGQGPHQNRPIRVKPTQEPVQENTTA